MVTWRELKACFDEFGVVVDAFIPQGKRNKATNFAFIRFQYESEIKKALKYGSKISIDGKRLMVKEADREREWKGNSSDQNRNIANDRARNRVVNSYREALMGGRKNSKEKRPQVMSQSQVHKPNEEIKTQSIKVSIIKEKFKWLSRFAIGKFKNTMACKSV
ncbi:hypothetical protein POUND7_003635 [Theobroma cacao]